MAAAGASSSRSLPPICILAGGLGTRLGDRVSELPKPLIEVAGEPFLIHQLRLLASHGIERAVICVGYRGEQIVETIGPERYGIEIDYSVDGAELAGTLGAIRGAQSQLGQRFLVLYGDTYLRVDYAGAALAWAGSGLPAMMAVFNNDGELEPSNASFDGILVTRYSKQAPTPEMRWIDYGLGGLTADALDLAGAAESDLCAFYAELARRGELFGFPATERFYDIGTPAALAETDAFLRSRATAS